MAAHFEIDPFRKYCFLNGLDEIGLTLRHADKIRTFEERRRTEQPWLFG
jgi:3-isopropylmalate/(R)-2-methylmalate dehydratase small subunit